MSRLSQAFHRATGVSLTKAVTVAGAAIALGPQGGATAASLGGALSSLPQQPQPEPSSAPGAYQLIVPSSSTASSDALFSYLLGRAGGDRAAPPPAASSPPPASSSSGDYSGLVLVAIVVAAAAIFLSRGR